MKHLEQKCGDIPLLVQDSDSDSDENYDPIRNDEQQSTEKEDQSVSIKYKTSKYF